MPRRSQSIPTNKIIRIFCEGPSEKQYFDMLIGKYNKVNVTAERISISVHGGKKGRALLKKAHATLIAQKNKKVDAAYVIFDRDDLKKEQLEECNTYARENGIQIMFSSICLEVWILMHFQKVNRVYSAKELNRVLSGEKYFNTDYSKFKGKPYDEFLYDKINLAKRNGDEMLKNKPGLWYQYDPYTNISKYLHDIFPVDTF